MSKQAKAAELESIVDVAVDDGHAGIKLAVLENGRITKFLRINSRARAGIHGTTMIDHPSSDDGGIIVPGYSTAGAQYTVGDFADAEGARFDDYPVSGLNRVLVHHALRMAGLGGRKVRLATGLPLSRFFKGEKPNDSLIKAKDEAIRLPVLPADGSATAEIVEHRVFPEGLGAWINYAVGDDGELRDGLEDETVAIVDIGGRTTDTAVILPGRRIDHARSGSADIGVLNVIEAMAVALLKDKGVEIPAHSIESSLVTRSIRMWGKDQDVGAFVDAAAEEVLTRIMREINRRLGTGVDIDKILLVGGGAHVFKAALTRYPNIIVAEKPEFANAFGFAKYLGV